MKIENTTVYGLDNAIKVSKYPMAISVIDCNNKMTNTVAKLGQCEIGTGHDNFLNGVIVQFDLTASNKMWVELQRYHFIDFISSQSTMHRIAQFNIENQVNKYVTKKAIENLKELIADYNNDSSKENYLKVLYNIPSGFELTAGMTTNYRQLKTIYYQRKNHRLPEWNDFCKWVETLPKFKELVLGE